MTRTAYTKRDANHKAIQRALNDAGHTTWDVAAAGGGVPDLLSMHCKRRIWVLFEVKTEEGRLTPSQVSFFGMTAGAPRHVVTTPAEAVEIMHSYD